MSLIELPQDEINRAMMVEQMGDASLFGRGDLVNRWIKTHGGSAYQVAYSYAHAVNGSGETWRDAARVAAAVPPEMREEFDPLGFYQWRAIVPARDRMREVALWAVEVYPLEHGGRPASYEAISAHVHGAPNGAGAAFYHKLTAVQRAHLRAINDDRLPEDFRLFMRRVHHIIAARWGEV